MPTVDQFIIGREASSEIADASMHLEWEEKVLFWNINSVQRLSLGILLGAGVDYNTICSTLIRVEE